MSWFESWFDSKYYHILYQNRDDNEAKCFIDNLLNAFHFHKGARLLDLACGKGRHSIYLHSKGYHVTGVDLSPASIEEAAKHIKEGLSFEVHDMREDLNLGDFDAVLNLFTSFGYFESEMEHIEVLKSASKNIKNKNGVLIIDFMNARKVINSLVLREDKTLAGIDFHIRRYIENLKIIKEIQFEDQGHHYFFKEMVNAFFLNDFERMLAAAGMKIFKTFGNYSLDAFDELKSDRLIIAAKLC